MGTCLLPCRLLHRHLQWWQSLVSCVRFGYVVFSGLASDHAAGDMFPASYNLSIINAQHGSWDRTPKLGYRVMVLNLNEDGLALNHSVLAEGWLLPNGTTWGESVQFHFPLSPPCFSPSRFYEKYII